MAENNAINKEIITESEGIGDNDNDTSVPTSAAVRDYVEENALTPSGTATLTNKTIDGDDNTLQNISSESLKSTVAFRAYRNAARNAGSNVSPAIIDFDTESFDRGSDFDIATNVGRFTAPVAGDYSFNSRAQITAGDTGWFTIYLYKNGSLYSRGVRVMASSSHVIGAVVSDIIPLAANDYVEVFTQSNASQALSVGNSTNCYFSGHLIGTV